MRTTALHLLYDRRGLETIQARHLNVHQDEVDVLCLLQKSDRLLPRFREDEVVVRREQGIKRKQVGLLVVDGQNVGSSLNSSGFHGYSSPRASGAPQSAAAGKP